MEHLQAGTDSIIKKVRSFQQELAKNMEMWAEEKGESMDDAVKGEDLRNVGVTGGDLNTDIADQTTPEEAPEGGGPGEEGGELEAGEDDFEI